MKKYLSDILIISIPLLFAIIAYFFLLPEKIPVQLTTNGVRYANKAYIFIFALIPAIVYIWYKKRK
jgi:hypothetical protein